MPDEFGDNKLTQAEADELMSPLENDLTALFSYMRDDMLETLLDYEGIPEDFIDAILGPLQEEGGAVAKDMQNVNEGGKIMKSKCNVKKVMSPGPGEDEQKFVSRCISHEMGKGKDQKQAAAICYSIFRESKKDMVIRKATEMIKSITERIKGK